MKSNVTVLGFLGMALFPSYVLACGGITVESAIFTLTPVVLYFIFVGVVISKCIAFRKETGPRVYFKVSYGIFVGLILLPFIVFVMNTWKHIQEERMWEQERIKYQKSCDELKAQGKQCPFFISGPFYPMC
jgi:hypothetical protein